MSLQQKVCTCGARVVGEPWEQPTIDEWADFHTKICHAGLTDEQPFTVSLGHSCGYHAYGESQAEAVENLNQHKANCSQA